jgi:DDE superfamily endonuclease
MLIDCLLLCFLLAIAILPLILKMRISFHSIDEDRMLLMGLEWIGFSADRQEDAKKLNNIRRFKAAFGCSPSVLSKVWADIVANERGSAGFKASKKDVQYFFLGLMLLKCYLSTDILSGIFDCSERTVRTKTWNVIKMIQALKTKKARVKLVVSLILCAGCICLFFCYSHSHYRSLLQIVWPKEWSDDHSQVPTDTPVFIVSIDGVHCRMNEPKHPTLAKDPKYYSHKFRQSAVTYELAISIFDNKLVWMNGPFPAGKPDIKIFKNDGLMAKMPANKKAIGDRGYPGAAMISTPNGKDDATLRKFKGRVRARHESFNSRIKAFASLDNRFRHGKAKHKMAFEAVCVLCQYQIEEGKGLFEV